jgi:hypothetical protein
MTPIRIIVLFACAFGCAASEAGIEDTEDARAVTAGKSDGGIAEGSAEAIGILRAANESSRSIFINKMHLSTRVADVLLAYRVGDDEQVGTADDERFDTLEELDAVPFVGPQVFEALLAYARDHDLVPDCISVCTDDTHMLDCSAGGAQVACPLGCENNTCHAFAPSNLVPEVVRDVYLDGVTASLTVPTLTQMELDVDSGYIYRRGGPMSRKPPTGSSWGTPTYGVVDGIGFYDFNGLRVLVVRELKVAKGASLKVTSFNYKERCYDISGTPWPFSEQGYSLIDKKTFPAGLEWYENQRMHEQFSTSSTARGIVILSIGPVTINGVVDVSAAGPVGGPGGGGRNRTHCFNGCVNQFCPPGASTAGAAEANQFPLRPSSGSFGQLSAQFSPGSAYGRPSLTPLVGGAGYTNQSTAFGECVTMDVGGGGAIEIVSLKSIEIAASGSVGYAGINAGGAKGGGSGGAILLEAPQVRVGPGGLLMANGGSSTKNAPFDPNAGDYGGGTKTTTPKAGGGGFGRIRINAAPEFLDLDGAYISPLPSRGEPSLRLTSDIIDTDYVGKWSLGATQGEWVTRVVGKEVWAVHGNRRFVGRLQQGRLRGWWTKLPSRMPDADAGEFECSVPNVMVRALDCRLRNGTNGTWSAMPTTYAGDALAGELDAEFADVASFVLHPHW